MSARELHLSSAASPVARSEATGCTTEPLTPVRTPIDWRALRFADRACCCGARPAVVAVLPTGPGRSHPTDLLLCGHHYRAGQMALAIAGAAVFTVAGASVAAGDLWKVGADPDRET
jgi:hypothetical protein